MRPNARTLAPRFLVSLALLTAASAHAGTVYVPLLGVTSVGSATWEQDVTISNPSAQGIALNDLLLGNDTDGTQRGASATINLQAGQSTILKPGASFVGLGEIAGSPNARYAARLTGKGALGQMGVALPIITSDNRAVGASTVTLSGLSGNATRIANIALVNLGKLSSSCTVSFAGTNGAAVGAPQTVAMKALSQKLVTNAFNGLGAVVDVRATVSCSRDFYAFAWITDGSTGEITIVQPAGNGASTLTRPGEEAACPTGATCLTSPILFKPTPADPVGHVIFPAPALTAHRLKLSLDVTIGDWYAPDPDGKHLIYWFVINRNLDMPGMLYFRGPDAYTALARWGIGLKHPEKKKATQPFQGIPGHTYHVVNDFDMGAGVYTITITDVATQQTVTIVDVPNVAQVVLKSTDRFLVDVGFKENAVPDEVPSFGGWTYTNFRLDVIP
jgi:hypothetical protein